MKRFIERMIIDEGKQHALSHYFKKNGSKHKKSSDHNTLVMDLRIPSSKVKYQRKKFYNFRNPDCQKVFREITDCSEKLTKCFTNDQPLDTQCNRWFKELNEIFQQSFKKYRVNGKIKETEISQLSKKKNQLQQKIQLAGEHADEDILKEVSEIEDKIFDLVAVKNRNKVIENFGSLAKKDVSKNINGMWALKKESLPQKSTKPPCG